MNTLALRQSNGFTLVETIISILIFGIVGVLLLSIVRTGASLYEEVVSKTELRDNLYIAERRIVNDYLGVRDIKGFIYGDKTRIQFVKSNLDTIQYRYAAGKLYRKVNVAAEFPVAQYLTDSTRFYFYTSDDSAILTNPLDATGRLATWSLQLDFHAKRSYHTMEMRTAVFPQNYRYGIVKN